MLKKMDQLQKAILRTLAYADVFDYPLTFEELHRFLIGSKVSPKRLKIFVNRQSLIIGHRDGFYFLPGREKIVSLRQKREQWSQEKMKIAGRAAGWLKLIPWIKMVAVTGALAMNNSGQDDDVDFLIVVARGRLWLTRFLTVLLIELVTRRRRPGDREIKNKICLNMFLDEAHLKIPKKEQNLFTAHEVCQLKPIWQRDGVYQQFVKENQWLKRFLPNWKPWLGGCK